MATFYTNTKTKESTPDAATGLAWHRSGVDIIVNKESHSTIIKGAAIESEQERFNRIEGRERCERIAKEIDAYADGNVYKCPHCDEIIEFPESVGDKFKCPHCDEVSDIDEYEQLSIYDYLDDILDIDFTIDRYKNYKYCSICIGWGGPNIYIDTSDAYVKLYWGSTREQYPISYSSRDTIDEWAEEYYNYI